MILRCSFCDTTIDTDIHDKCPYCKQSYKDNPKYLKQQKSSVYKTQEEIEENERKLKRTSYLIVIPVFIVILMIVFRSFVNIVSFQPTDVVTESTNVSVSQKVDESQKISGPTRVNKYGVIESYQEETSNEVPFEKESIVNDEVNVAIVDKEDKIVFEENDDFVVKEPINFLYFDSNNTNGYYLDGLHFDIHTSYYANTHQLNLNFEIYDKNLDIENMRELFTFYVNGILVEPRDSSIMDLRNAGGVLGFFVTLDLEYVPNIVSTQYKDSKILNILGDDINMY